ncbi:MAG: hypothetical protein WD432_00260 [Candidatus Saccharimonadales bacterium]
MATISLLLASSLPVNAITVYELGAIGSDETIFYGGANLSQVLCNSESAANYVIITPEISDDEALADAIDEFIDDRESNSPLSGMGKYFVEGGLRAGINPIFVVAIAEAESSLGTNPNTTAIELGGHNAFGRTASSSQPHVQLNEGSRRWYAWDSWEKSLLSSSFPANGSVDNPDDIFQFIARRFDGNLENGLESFLAGDSGVSGYLDDRIDEVDSYIDTVTSVSNAIVDIAGDAIDISRINRGGGVCANFDDVVAAALLYAWPEYRSPSQNNSNQQKSEYTQAHRAAASRGEYLGGCGGNDCGAFTTRVIRDSGFDPNYNSGMGNTFTQMSYLRDNWIELGKGNTISSADLRPGDVAIKTAGAEQLFGHTFLYVGDQPGFASSVASSSLSSNCATSRAPMAGVERINDPEMTWFRNPSLGVE